MQEASEKYRDLFDFAPIGYFRLDGQGRILEVNLAGAALLGLDRSALIQKRFGQFVARGNRPAFVDFCKRVLTTDTRETCSHKPSGPPTVRKAGWGIGLTLAKRLVEMHAGTIGVSSTLGQGSEFVVNLVVCPPGAISPKTQPLPTEKAKRIGPPLRVLVVDDNMDAANVLELLVQEAGHLVRTARTGPTGLATALVYRPDVMLMDIGLPELDGFAVAKRMRQDPLLHDIVLVAMTGYGQDSDRQRMQEAGFDHYLVKPADFEKLRQILAAVAEKAT